MSNEKDGRTKRMRGGIAVTLGVLIAVTLGGCGGGSSLDLGSINQDLFGTSPSKGDNAAGVSRAEVDAANNDTPCPDVKVRSGAATLMVGDKPGGGEPAPLDVRYQGSIVRMARECHLNAGLLTIIFLGSL